MSTLITIVLVAAAFALPARIVRKCERGVRFGLGSVRRERQAGLRLISPLVDVPHRRSLRIAAVPMQSRGIITRDNVGVDLSAVACCRVVDPVRSVAIEDVYSAIDQMAQRRAVGRHTLGQALSGTGGISAVRHARPTRNRGAVHGR
jgi:regulator of protease activity HflC (stomatin/prohibitin superfamily)